MFYTLFTSQDVYRIFGLIIKESLRKRKCLTYVGISANIYSRIEKTLKNIYILILSAMQNLKSENSRDRTS